MPDACIVMDEGAENDASEADGTMWHDAVLRQVQAKKLVR